MAHAKLTSVGLSVGVQRSISDMQPVDRRAIVVMVLFRCSMTC